MDPEVKKQYKAVQKKYCDKFWWSYVASLLGPGRENFAKELAKAESHAGNVNVSSFAWVAYAGEGVQFLEVGSEQRWQVQSERGCVHSEGFCSLWPGYQRSLGPGWVPHSVGTAVFGDFLASRRNPFIRRAGIAFSRGEASRLSVEGWLW